MKLPKTHEEVVHLFETTPLYDAYKYDKYDVGDIVRESGSTLRYMTTFLVFRERMEWGSIRWDRVVEIREDDDGKTWRVKPWGERLYVIPKPAEVAA